MVSPSTFDLGPSSTNTVIVDVAIPSSAANGDNDVITIEVNDASGFATSISLTANVVAADAGAKRPQLAISTYNFGDKVKVVKAGSTFKLAVVVENRGQISAYNNTITFAGEGFFPIGTGGMQSIQNIEPGGKITFYQDFQVSDDMAWKEVGSITATTEYSDAGGNKYNNPFTISVPLTSPYNPATATPNSSNRPQLVVTNINTDIDPLQPGSIFELSLVVKNLGVSDAKSVVMVLGGGATTTNDTGTPQPSTSGGSADLTNFAPLGSSNLMVVGDIAKGSSVTIKQKLVVNVTTTPGAYTLKTSFVYTDSNGKKFVDDQVITLLVYSLPNVEVNFYRDPGQLTAGMPNTLPLQVTNLGKKAFVLGNMKVTSPDAEITNNVALVGSLDPGGYFTLDSEVIPSQEGTLTINIEVLYTDDFNQQRQVTQTLTVQVMPQPVITPEATPEGGASNSPSADSFWSKVGRFFKGLFGLDSGVQQPVDSGGEVTPSEVPIQIQDGGPKG